MTVKSKVNCVCLEEMVKHELVKLVGIFELELSTVEIAYVYCLPGT
jgi:hypothetical protein